MGYNCCTCRDDKTNSNTEYNSSKHPALIVSSRNKRMNMDLNIGDSANGSDELIFLKKKKHTR